MQKWEYYAEIKVGEPALDYEFEPHGDDGWELVTVVESKREDLKQEWTYYFKRPKN